MECARIEGSRSLANRLWDNIKEDSALAGLVREFEVPELAPVPGKHVGKAYDPAQLSRSLPRVQEIT